MKGSLFLMFPLALGAASDGMKDEIAKIWGEKQGRGEVNITFSSANLERQQEEEGLRNPLEALEKASVLPEIQEGRPIIQLTDGEKMRISYYRDNLFSLRIPWDTPVDSFIPLMETNIAKARETLETKREVEETLRQSHGFRGLMVRLGANGIDNDGQLAGIRFLRDFLHNEGRHISFRNVRTVYFTTAKTVRLLYLYSPPHFVDVHIPVESDGPTLATSLEEKFSLHRLGVRVDRRMRECCSYQGSSLTVGGDIGERELGGMLRRFDPFLERGNLDLSMIDNIVVSADERVSVQHLVGGKVYLVVAANLPAENLGAMVAEELAPYQLCWEIQKILAERYNYKGQSSPIRHGGIDTETFERTLRSFKQVLLSNERDISLEDIHRFFITPGNHAEYRRYSGGGGALFIPTEMDPDFLMPSIYLEISSPDDIAREVTRGFQALGAKDLIVEKNPYSDIGDQAYREVVENVWLALDWAIFKPNLEGFSHAWISGGRGGIQIFDNPDSSRSLFLPSTLSPKTFVPLLGLALGQLEESLGASLSAYGFTGQVDASWGAKQGEFALGQEGLWAALEGWEENLDMGSIDRIVITAVGEEGWFLNRPSSLEIYIPADISIESIRALIRRALASEY